MIFFLVTNENRQTMDWYLSSRGKKIITLIQLLEYERIFKKDKFLPGVYIFSDLGLLSDDQRKQAVQIWDKLKEQYPGQAVLLNHPAKAKRRYDLLKHLHAKEINRFNTYRLNENLSEIKFPVMFRYQADNSGNPATLLHNHDELNQAVASVKGGPVDAVYHALRKMISSLHKEVGNVSLVNYKVMIAEDKGAESSVRVYIEFKSNGEEWGTVGVSTNILEASLEAIEKGFRYYLCFLL